MRLYTTTLAFLITFSITAQETSKIHINLGTIMNQGMQVGIGKKVNENRYFWFNYSRF